LTLRARSARAGSPLRPQSRRRHAGGPRVPERRWIRRDAVTTVSAAESDA